MADIPQQPISSQQTLDNSSNFIEDAHVPYIFNIDPFSPLNSSFFTPSYHHHHHHHQVNSTSCSSCASEPDPESESLDSSTVYPDCLYDESEYDLMDFITNLFDSPRGGETEHVSGLRVSRIESDSDTEEEELLLDEVSEQQHNNNNNDIIQTTDLNLESFWDCPSFDTSRIEETSVSSDVGVLEWEILLAVNDLERGLEHATDGGEAEFDTLIGQFVETVRALRGGPPAAKSVVDNLPLVALKVDDDEICAVCKEEVSVGEEVMQLPCEHRYHGECIVPWLKVRNTCPVCRFELPTDDVDYERMRVRYGLDL